jgi:hypothetical protein
MLFDESLSLAYSEVFCAFKQQPANIISTIVYNNLILIRKLFQSDKIKQKKRIL